jgi:linoleoyl-CoA desaturase
MQKQVINGNSFTETLYSRANQYFVSQSTGKYGSFAFHFKATVLIALYVASYTYFVFFSASLGELILMALILGICHVFIPVNISHDAIHNSVSSRKWINQLALHGFELTGSNSYMYKKKHLEAHYNKENGSKTIAIESQALLMQKNDAAKTKNLHYIFYVFYAIYMIFIRDFILYADKSEKAPLRYFIKLLFFKAIYVVSFLVLPFIFNPLPWWQVAVALFFMYLIVTIVLVIILLMPTEKMENSRVDTTNGQNEKWVIEILEHNVDFSPGSVTLNFIAGGANLNVVHYLFPEVNHVHYNKLAVIIEQTAKEHNLIYRKQVVKDVFGIHFNYIKNIQGTNTEAV